MGVIDKKFAGLDALCKYYQELGIKASVIPDKSLEAIEKGLIRQDKGYIKVTGQNFDLVTIRMKGTTSGSYDLGKIRGVPIATKQKIPFEYHHIVRTDSVDEKAIAAKLKKKTKGITSKEVTDVSWEGGQFASSLNSNTELNKSIMRFIEPEDGIKVEPDKKNKIIRIVFSRPSEIKSGLVYGFKFNRNLLPKEAVTVMDNIAGLARKTTSGRR
ncbi:MAG: hypothetical protein AM324_001030 [Candidatus Thorarchaeota archaeon SMTZ1-83]|nr:MAG: hypothetical protein AM324_01785 [Candidatus Thorarchaeota archaeon SMTZ1-83]